MYLLDTCVLSEARRKSPAVAAWIASVRSADLFVSAMTIGELARGVDLKLRSDPRGGAPLALWLDQIRDQYRDRILPVDDAVAMRWGALMAVRPRPIADGLIAATAYVFGKSLVTRNVADFADAGVQIINPWAL
jgi:predicted nucleic acid-binding protein